MMVMLESPCVQARLLACVFVCGRALRVRVPGGGCAFVCALGCLGCVLVRGCACALLVCVGCSVHVGLWVRLRALACARLSPTKKDPWS